MANIFKTTLKKDIIANIENDNQREIRFPITKFWATRLAETYNLEDKIFEFKVFDSLELSSPSNKDTISETYVFDFVKTYVNGDEFVVEFKKDNIVDVDEQPTDVEVTTCEEEAIESNIPSVDDDNDIESDVSEDDACDDTCVKQPSIVIFDDISNVRTDTNDNEENEDDKTVFNVIQEWFDENILKNLYEDEFVFATNARQVVILPKGKVLGSKRTLPVNNDVEVRVEFDMNEKVYLDTFEDVDAFSEYIIDALVDIKKNNFVFIWKRYTGIFKDTEGRIHFGIKYSTRKTIGFNRKYNVQ